MTPRLRLAGLVLGTDDVPALAAFYQRLLGWDQGADEPDWATLRNPDGGPGLSFQTEVDHVRPVWPASPGEPLMMAHLDIEVDDLATAGAHAEAAGAVLAEFQPQDDVRVFYDPDGHSFCLYAHGDG